MTTVELSEGTFRKWSRHGRFERLNADRKRIPRWASVFSSTIHSKALVQRPAGTSCVNKRPRLCFLSECPSSRSRRQCRIYRKIRRRPGKDSACLRHCSPRKKGNSNGLLLEIRDERSRPAAQWGRRASRSLFLLFPVGWRRACGRDAGRCRAGAAGARTAGLVGCGSPRRLWPILPSGESARTKPACCTRRRAQVNRVFIR